MTPRHGLPDDERFGQQHPGDTDESNNDQELFESPLAGIEVGCDALGPSLSAPKEHHVDEGDEDGGGAALGQRETLCIGIVFGPLDKNKQGKIAEHGTQKQDLWYELCVDVEGLLKILVVEEGQDDAEKHVQDAKDDGDLHFEPVQKDDFVFCQLPDGVDAKRVRRAVVGLVAGRIDHVVFGGQDGLFGVAHLPRGAKDVDGFREHVVVDQPGIDGEKGHQGD